MHATFGRGFLTVLELGLAKARTDCVNGDGASSPGTGPSDAIPPGVGETFDSRPTSPASPSYSPETSDDETPIDNHERAIGLASVAEVRLLEVFPRSMPSFEAILHWTEFFLLGEYAYKDVPVYALERIVEHFVQLRLSRGSAVPPEGSGHASTSSTLSG